MTRKDLFRKILEKKSYLCVGLDTDIKRVPKHLLKYDDPVLEFNKQIIEATHDLCVGYKPNLAFYESLGPKGWITLEKTLELIPEGHFTIADAKRGDIGNTSNMYARAFFESMNFDSVTIAPYMGEDSVKPFLGFDGKWVILLALTSNPGSADFQRTLQENDEPLFEKVMHKATTWGSEEEIMFVVGATHSEDFKRIRAIAPDHFLLVPGVGKQGGDLQTLSRLGMNDHCGLLVNSSRGIIYAGGDSLDFAEKAREAALKVQQEMAVLLEERFF